MCRWRLGNKKENGYAWGWLTKVLKISAMINASIIESKFLRSRPKLEFTRLWKETDEWRKTPILKDIIFNMGEIPLISYFQDDLCWWLISNESLYIKKGKVVKFTFKELVKVDITPLLGTEICKTELSGLEVYTENDHIDLFVERLSWPVIYTILQFAIKKEKI
jgi:hypothetical protein